MISVFHTHFETPFLPKTWNKYLTQLPLDLQKKINRFVRWQDRQANLLSILLLKEGLKRFGLPCEKLLEIKYTQFKRPYIEGGLEFNISHSGEYVVCGLSDEGNLGIDIEKIHHIEIARFKTFFSEEQFSLLSGNHDLYGFFRLWTKLESVIKWEGSGLYANIKKVQLNKDRAVINGKTCFLQEVFIHREYPCYLSTENNTSRLLTEKFTLGNQ